MKFPKFCWLLLSTIATSAHCEQLFVADKLVLNVYAESNQSGGRIATIETGDAIEALERADKFVRVRLADGREGWVGANYLSTEPPALLKLKELERSVNNASGDRLNPLAADVARLKKQNASLQTEISTLQKRLAALSAPAPTSTSTSAATPANVAMPIPAVAAAVDTQSTSLPQQETSTHTWAWLIALAITGGGGFVAGYQTLGHKVRRRFGRLKIY